MRKQRVIKQVLTITMGFSMLLCGCGSNQKTDDSSQVSVSSEQVDTNEEEHTEQPAENVTEDAEEGKATASPAESQEKDISVDHQTETEKKETVAEQKENTDSSFVEAGDSSVDYTKQIENEVQQNADTTNSLQKELEGIGKLYKKYSKVLEKDYPQVEMNQLAEWPYKVWDVELNHLWGRRGDFLSDAKQKELLSEQRNWIALKEKMVKEILSDVEGGSIYPMLYADEMANLTKNRVYILASLFAKEKGENFQIPKRKETGIYVDSQGTKDVYSSLIIQTGMENGDFEGILAIHRVGTARGTVKVSDGGKLFFTNADMGLEAEITYGWDGAKVTITKTDEDPLGPFYIGDVYQFPIAL